MPVMTISVASRQAMLTPCGGVINEASWAKPRASCRFLPLHGRAVTTRRLMFKLGSETFLHPGKDVGNHGARHTPFGSRASLEFADGSVNTAFVFKLERHFIVQRRVSSPLDLNDHFLAIPNASRVTPPNGLRFFPIRDLFNLSCSSWSPGQIRRPSSRTHHQHCAHAAT